MSSTLFNKPSTSSLNDHDVTVTSSPLNNVHIGLLITGGIAAYRIPDFIRDLRKLGAQVTPIVSQSALRFVTKETLSWCASNKVVSSLSPESEHLRSSKPYDIVIMAPATYNSINKAAQGTADSPLLTAFASALGNLENKELKSLLIAPTMHGSMHTSILEESCLKLQSLGVTVIPPRDDYGKHNLPDSQTLIDYMIRSLSTSSLRGKRFLVSGGSIGSEIDDVRLLTSRFSGQTARDIATALIHKGACVDLVMPKHQLPESESFFLKLYPVAHYNDYTETIEDCTHSIQYDAFISAAAVADYQPLVKTSGKIPSGGAMNTLKFKPTEKVIDVILNRKDVIIPVVSFKYEAEANQQELKTIAFDRISKGHAIVVANSGSSVFNSKSHEAIVVSNQGVDSVVGKENIALKLCDILEKKLDTYFADPSTQKNKLPEASYSL